MGALGQPGPVVAQKGDVKMLLGSVRGEQIPVPGKPR